jgi:hypothetical protein
VTPPPRPKGRSRQHFNWDGRPKKVWPTLEDATRHADQMGEWKGLPYSAYRCYCDGFHIGRNVRVTKERGLRILQEDIMLFGDERVAWCLKVENSGVSTSRFDQILRRLAVASRPRLGISSRHSGRVRR